MNYKHSDHSNMRKRKTFLIRFSWRTKFLWWSDQDLYHISSI